MAWGGCLLALGLVGIGAALVWWSCPDASPPPQAVVATGTGAPPAVTVAAAASAQYSAREPVAAAPAEAAAPMGSAPDPGPVYASGRVFGPAPLPLLQVRAVQVVEQRFEWRDDLAFVLHGDGTFELRGRDADRAPVRQFLDVRAEGCAPVSPVDFAAGDRDLQIHLEPGGTLTVRLLVGPTVLAHPEVLRCEWRGLDDADWVGCNPVAADGALELLVPGLATDTYALRVRFVGDPEPLFAVGNLLVHPGEELRDARLLDVDLRHLRAVRLRLVEQGKLVDVAGSWVPSGLDRIDEALTGFEHGVAWIGCRDTIDVVVSAANRQLVRVAGPGCDTDIAMEPALDVMLQLEDLPPAPQGAWYTVAWLAPPGGLISAHALFDLVDATYPFVLPAGGRLQLSIPEPGEIGFRLQLVRRTPAGDRTAEVATTARHIVTRGEHRWAVTAQQVEAAQAQLDR
jgi:hypothetical protein